MRGQTIISGVDVQTDYLLGLRDIVTRTRVRRANTGSLTGHIAGKKRGRGSIFYDVRPWSDGDDVRHIDCHKTARTGAPHIRTSHEDCENKHILLADLRSSMFFGTRRALRAVVAAEAIAITGWRAVSARDQIGLLLVTSRESRFIGWADDAAKFASLLHELASVYREAKNMDSSSDPNLDDMIELALKHSGSASIIIASALDAPGKNFDRIAGLTAKRRDLMFLMISDIFERDPLPGYYPYYTSEGDSGVLHISRRLDQQAQNEWPDRLARLGARSLVIGSELYPPEIARILDRFYDGSR